jgi:hypothetical protein
MKILLIVLLLPFSVLSEMMSFSVSPGVVKYETVQGGIKTFDLYFSNQGKHPLRANIQIMDLSLDDSGVPVVSSASTKDNQWSKYVSINKSNLLIDANQSEKIHVTIKIPRSAVSGGYFAVVFNVSNVSKKSKIKRTHNVITIGSQMPVLFIGEVTRIGSPNINVLKGAINKAPFSNNKPFKLRFTLNNSGTTHTYVDGDVLLRYDNKVISRLKLKSGSGLILPKGNRNFLTTWSDHVKYSGKRVYAEGRFSFQGGRVNKKITFIAP